MNAKVAISILTVVQSISLGPIPMQSLDAHPVPAAPQASSSAPRCAVTGTHELKINCSYSADSQGGAEKNSTPRIILNRAALSFNTADESKMRVELTFTNDSGSKIAEHRSVYLTIEDEKGENHVRRLLPHVDFTKLEPGKPVTFQEILLTPAFSAGSYTISIWIPSTDPSSKFDPAHDFLLSSNGVQDRATGLNRIAKFTALIPSRGKSTE